ncbi:hypothetical protein BC829DRAFT_430912 [Chytridium lagenaria]|nr:hypothetical protein BC829DRAFT_430912 [Chytridium lagenaria]
MAGEHSHRSTLKQSNKSFKSKHASKGELKTRNKGKAERGPIKGPQSQNQTKADRRKPCEDDSETEAGGCFSVSTYFHGNACASKDYCCRPLCPDVSASVAISEFISSMELENALNLQILLDWRSSARSFNFFQLRDQCTIFLTWFAQQTL